MRAVRRVTRWIGAGSALMLACGLAFATPAGAATAGGSAPAPAARPAPVLRTGGIVTPAAHVHAVRSPAKHAPRLSRSEAGAVRAREAALATANRAAPRFDADGLAVTTFTVNTSTDSGLANPAGTTCVDAATGACSLRAAVEAADNLKTPVDVKLPAGGFTLTTGALILDSDPGGVSITGLGPSKTTIKGDGSGILEVAAATSTSPSAVLFLTGVTLKDGSATYGAALYLYYEDAGSRAVLDDDVLTDNKATSEGGAVFSDYGSLYMTDTTVSDNQAEDGGAIYQYWGYADLVGDSITSNFTTPGETGYAGGIYSEYGIVDVTKGWINSNTAGDKTHPGYGAAVYDDGETDYTLNGVTVNGNTAKDGGEGGAFYLDFDQLDVTGGSISHDTAAVSGGGIYVYYGSQIALHGVKLTGDLVPGHVANAEGGGTIYDDVDDYGNSIVIDDGSTITDSNNAAIYLYGYYGDVVLDVSNSTLSHDTDDSTNVLYYSTSDYSGCGGAICAYSYYASGENINLQNDTIEDNSSSGYFAPGAVGIYNWEYASSSAHLDGDTFRGNSAKGEYGSGAVQDYGYYYAQSSLEASGSTFASNSATYVGYGGAIDTYGEDEYSPIDVSLTADHFTGNTAGSSSNAGDGGAIALYYYSALTDDGSTFSGNRAVGADAEGGAIVDWSYQSARFTGTVFSDNTASSAGGAGGAVYTDDYGGGDAYDGVTISGNKADYGGGVYTASDGYELRFVDSTISGNTAFAHSTTAGEGGGLDIAADSIVSLVNSTVADNTAKAAGSKPGEGGGIFYEGYVLAVAYSTVSSNSAGLGGGVYADGFGGSLMASIVSGNGSHNCTAAGTKNRLSSLGENVLASGCVEAPMSTDRVTSSPGLKPLAHNGGPTETMALTSTSPALNRGGFDCPSTDERGAPRSATACDAGAYQAAAGHITKISPSTGVGGTSVTISGQGFSFAEIVYFGTSKAKFRVVSDSKIVATAPGHSAGKVNVKVMTPDGSDNVAVFTYK